MGIIRSTTTKTSGKPDHCFSPVVKVKVEMEGKNAAAMKPAATVQLAAPGAGIPPLELAAAKLLFAILRRMKTRGWATKHFHSEASTMVRVAGNLTPQAANRQVLIPRITGIED